MTNAEFKMIGLKKTGNVIRITVGLEHGLAWEDIDVTDGAMYALDDIIERLQHKAADMDRRMRERDGAA